MLFNQGLSNRIQSVLESTYDSVVTVKRLTDGKVGNATQQTRPIVLSNVPCRRSKTSQPTIHPTTGAATITYSEKLFVGPQWDIRAGDELFVTGPIGAINAGPDRYFTGKPTHYTTHQEVRLEIVGRA